MSVTHDALAEDLALSIGVLPYLNVVLGSAWLSGADNKTPRADVLGIKPSYTRFCVAIYEVKISRSDFLSDIRSGKWRSYLPHCHRFYFATLPGICSREDIPAEAGWMVRTDKSWTTRKPAMCGHCRTNRDLSRLVVCECCGKEKPLAEFLDPNSRVNRNCRACIESGAVREKAYRKQSRTMRRKEHVQERAREIVWPEIVIPGDPFSGDWGCAG